MCASKNKVERESLCSHAILRVEKGVDSLTPRIYMRAADAKQQQQHYIAARRKMLNAPWCSCAKTQRGASLRCYRKPIGILYTLARLKTSSSSSLARAARGDFGIPLAAAALKIYKVSLSTISRFNGSSFFLSSLWCFQQNFPIRKFSFMCVIYASHVDFIVWSAARHCCNIINPHDIKGGRERGDVRRRATAINLSLRTMYMRFIGRICPFKWTHLLFVYMCARERTMWALI